MTLQICTYYTQMVNNKQLIQQYTAKGFVSIQVIQLLDESKYNLSRE